MSLVWRDQLSVGNNVIDSDHKQLIAVVNEVEKSLSTKNLEGLSASLDCLLDYSQQHFAREEKIAQAAGYAEVPYLHQSHAVLATQLDQVKSEIAAMGQDWSSTTVEHFTNLLRNWLIDHVIKEDLLMKPALQKHPPSFNAD
jgi:hemerythrin